MDEFSAYRARVDAALERHLRLPDVPEKLREAMHYGVFAGGKRVRPALCVFACQAVGAEASIAATKAEALKSVEQVAADAAGAIVTQLIGGKTTAAAVKKAIADVK